MRTEKMVLSWNLIHLHWKCQACAEFECATKQTSKSDFIFRFLPPLGKVIDSHVCFFFFFSEFKDTRYKGFSRVCMLCLLHTNDWGITKIIYNYIRFPDRNSLLNKSVLVNESLLLQRENPITPIMKTLKIWYYINISTCQLGKPLMKNAYNYISLVRTLLIIKIPLKFNNMKE